MKLHHFFINQDLSTPRRDVSQKLLSIEDSEIIHQIKDVLKLKIGQQLILLDGQGSEALGIIESWDKKHIAIKILEVKENNNEPLVHTTLYCAILKKENFELATQKAVEVGIKEIFPIITQRTVKLNINQTRLEKIIKESAEQSERAIIPIIHPTLAFAEAINSAKKYDLVYFFNKTGVKLAFNKPTKVKSIAIFIGPEGGWTDEEIMMAKNSDFRIVSLGDLTLRGETAVIVASYLVNNL
jgi:16S rRNA (uracil1498-N3)-methyltransferase